MPFPYHTTLSLIKRVLSPGKVVNPDAGQNVDASGSLATTKDSIALDVGTTSAQAISSMSASGPEPECHGHVRADVDRPTTTANKSEARAVASASGPQDEKRVASDPPGDTDQHYFFKFAEEFGCGLPHYVPTGLEAHSSGSLPANAGHRLRLGGKLVNQIALHRAAGLGDTITIVIDKARLMGMSSNSEGMSFWSMESIVALDVPPEGLAFTVSKKQASAILSQDHSRLDLSIMPGHIRVRQGDGIFRLARLVDPTLPHVQNFKGAQNGTVDPVRLAYYFNASKPFLGRTDAGLDGIAIRPSGLDAYCHKSIFSSTVKLGSADLALTPPVAKAAISALRLLGASAEVRDHGDQYSVASNGGFLLAPKSLTSRMPMKPLEKEHAAILFVPTSKVLWPAIGATTRIVDDEPLQVSMDVRESAASLEFFYLSRKGSRSIFARATVEGLTLSEPALKAARFTAYVDGRQLYSAILQAAHDGTITLEWVKPHALRLSYTIEQVPVQVMLAGKMPDKNGGLNTTRRR